jgi:lipoate-protein ligase A
MICIQSSFTDPRFNLAAEEYLLKKTGQEFFILYRNDPSVIIGKHQNALAELNLPYVNEHGIDVVRRISGGGTVYHDRGNLNYCFIRQGIKGQLVDFIKHTQPLIDFLASLGLQAEFDGRNSLLLRGKKISGNAEHVYRDRVLHHGTLLFSSDLDCLSGALKVTAGRYRDKSIRSLRSPVANLADHMEEAMDINTLTERFMDYIKSTHPHESAGYEYTEGDLEEIGSLVEEKYGRWEWNYGYSPEYIFKKTVLVSGQTLKIRLEVERGIIRGAGISGELPDGGVPGQLEKELIGRPHSLQALRSVLTESGKLAEGFDPEALLAGFF